MQICLNCLNSYPDNTGICPHCEFGRWQYVLDENCLSLGILLKDRYKIGTKIGSGGFGITYRAVDMRTGRAVAIKEYFPVGIVTRKSDHRYVTLSESGKEQTFRKGIDNFLEEAKDLARFRGIKNIVQVYDFFEQNGTAYIVMEYLRGRSLSQLAAENGGRLDYMRVAEIMMDVINALEIVHAAGMVHRDISPDNIFIGNDGVIRLIDFGAARESRGFEDVTLSIVLKPSYAPPEQFRKKSRQGPWTDIYALGATMYRILTGNIPPESVSRLVEDDLLPPSVYTPGIPKEFDRIIMKMMSLTVEERYHDIRLLREDLAAAINNNSRTYAGMNAPKAYAGTNEQGAYEIKSSSEVNKPAAGKKKNKGLIAIYIIAAVFIIAVIILVVLVIKDKSDPDDGDNTYGVTEEPLPDGDVTATPDPEEPDTTAAPDTEEPDTTAAPDTEEPDTTVATGEDTVDYGYFIYGWNDTIIYTSDYLFTYPVEEIISGSTLNYEPLTEDADNHEYTADISLGAFDRINLDGDEKYTNACMISGSSYTDADTENIYSELVKLYEEPDESVTGVKYLWKTDTTYIFYAYDTQGIYLIYMTQEYWDENNTEYQ